MINVRLKKTNSEKLYISDYWKEGKFIYFEVKKNLNKSL